MTQTLSAGFHVQRFFEPWSGTLWGGTGFSDPLVGLGLQLWESVDAGQTWLHRQELLAGGNRNAGGWYAVSDSEWLLSYEGPGLGDLGVLRGTVTAPGSLAWTQVLSLTGFAQVLRTDSGHLLFGFEQGATTQGGGVYRSYNGGLDWELDSQPTKQGNLALRPGPDGSVDAFVARMTVGPRTDWYRNHTPDEPG